MEKVQEVKRMRSKVKEQFLPFLLKESESIEDARMLCTALSIALEQAFLNKQREFSVKDLKLVDMLQGEKSDRWKTMLQMFEDEKINDALQMIKEFPREIDMWIREEMKDRKLDSLKINLLD